MGEVETGGGVVEPEVFGRRADYCWRSVCGLTVGVRFGGHCWGEMELESELRMIATFDAVVCLLLGIASSRMQGRDLP